MLRLYYMFEVEHKLRLPLSAQHFQGTHSD